MPNQQQYQKFRENKMARLRGVFGTTKLIEGRSYLFNHKRKGTFHGIFRGIQENRSLENPDDPDRQLITVDIDTSKETGNQKLARTKDAKTGRWSAITQTNLRPSLILGCQEMPMDNEPYTPPPEQMMPTKKEEEGFRSRLGKLLNKLGIKS